jgi:hypothetical protein
MGISVVASADCDRHGRGDLHGRFCRPRRHRSEGATVGAGVGRVEGPEIVDDRH